MRIWFNRHFSVVARVIRLLRDAERPLPLTVLVSHKHEHFVGYALADEAFVEPVGLGPDDYLGWCLETVRRRRVDWLVPGHEQGMLTANADAFAAAGCRILHAAPAAVLQTLHSKDWVYGQCAGTVAVPPHRLIVDPRELTAAVAELEREDAEVCIKPTVSVYGKGFGRITARDDRAGQEARQHVAEWLASRAADGTCAPQLVMRYLPGPEFSVDLVARDGEVLAAVTRRKAATSQVLEDRPDLLDAARRLVAMFRLNALINVQFRNDAAGVPMLLEINPRASGGIGMSCLSGVNLPDLALRTALRPGQPLAVPRPRLNIRVSEVSHAVVIPAADAVDVVVPDRRTA